MWLKKKKKIDNAVNRRKQVRPNIRGCVLRRVTPLFVSRLLILTCSEHWSTFSPLDTDIRGVEDRLTDYGLFSNTKHKQNQLYKLEHLSVSHSEQATQMKGTYKWIYQIYIIYNQI